MAKKRPKQRRPKAAVNDPRTRGSIIESVGPDLPQEWVGHRVVATQTVRLDAMRTVMYEAPLGPALNLAAAADAHDRGIKSRTRAFGAVVERPDFDGRPVLVPRRPADVFDA